MIDWTGIHRDRGFRLAYLPLSLMSALYGTGVRLRLKTIRQEQRLALPGFTISIGNITAGGTGKTPATIMITEWAQKEGYNAAILSRGYGGKNTEGVTIVSDGRDTLAGPKDAGDEPYLLAKRLPGIPVLTARDRYVAGITAHERFGTSLFILDDGFQHLRLIRDLDLLLLDAAMPLGNGRLLPRGPLREPASGISRADAVILTRAGDPGAGKDADRELGGLLKDRPLFMCRHQPDRVVLPSDNHAHEPSFLKGRRVVAFAGIARPDSFQKTLEGLGAEVVSLRAFPDHHPFSGEEIRGILGEWERLGADMAITTEKDWVRIAGLLPQGHPVSYLTIRFDFIDQRDAFFRMLRAKIIKKGVIS